MTLNIYTYLGEPAYPDGELKKVSELINSSGKHSKVTTARFIHFLHLSEALTEVEESRVIELLTYGLCVNESESSNFTATVIPRFGTISPWSSKATDIFRLCGQEKILRVERGICWFFETLNEIDRVEKNIHDRMTHQVVWGKSPVDSQYGDSFQDIFREPLRRPLVSVKLGTDPDMALAQANNKLGLALSSDEMVYLKHAYMDLGRDPTDVELMMFAQANSEHCRHKVFNASWSIDDEEQNHSLFQMIRNTYRQINGKDILSAYSDNAAVISGPNTSQFRPDPTDHIFRYRDEPAHILMKVETHNHPTAIAPYPGASTGSGGEIRDEGAVGRGSKPKAGLVGFTTSNLRIPGDIQPWERHFVGSPDRIASALEIMLEGPIGAAGFNNEYGRPAVLGYFRTFESYRSDNLIWGYHKPVMLAGGIGSIREVNVNALDAPLGAKLIVIGGPAMLIGLGGGAASSMGSGQSDSELDFASVQRDNAELQRRCQEVIDSCTAMGADNPIRLIHDVGAGGLSNALPELINDLGLGGIIDLRAIPNSDVGMSPMEIWCNEAQERYVLAISTEQQALFEAICARERCPYAIVGETVREQKIQVLDPDLEGVPVDMDLATLLGKPPKMNLKYSERKRSKAPLDLVKIDFEESLLRVLRFPAVGSKKFLVTIGDRSITGLVAQDQMVGPYQVPVGDAAVTLSGYQTFKGEAMAMGERSPVATVDPSAAARLAIAESLTNLAGVHLIDIDRIVMSANWMAAVDEPGEQQALYESVKTVGMELCPDLGIAIPVGKDSLSMRTDWEDQDRSLTVVSPVTLNVTAFGPVEDVRNTVTPMLRGRGATKIILLAMNSELRLGGSALAQVNSQIGDTVPDVDNNLSLKRLLEYVQCLVAEGHLLALHDRSDGGLITTLLEMSFAGRVGIDILWKQDWKGLFSEEIGIAIEVPESAVKEILCEAESIGLYALVVARTRKDEQIQFEQSGYRSTRGELERIWAKTSYLLQRIRDDSGCADEEYSGILSDTIKLQDNLTFDPERDVAAPYVNFNKSPRAAVLRDQGVNGQLEMAAAFNQAGFEAVDVHMTDLFDGRSSLGDFNVLVACGGFSYGDVLGGGGGWAKTILHNNEMRKQFERFFQRDTIALGVCNGCQMLSQITEIIPGTMLWPRFVRNRSDQFESRMIQVKVDTVPGPWLAGMEESILTVPVAHGEGRVLFPDGLKSSQLSNAGLVALRYVDGLGKCSNRYPSNPNGSVDGIAGVVSGDGRVFALMPHPERVFRAVQNSVVDRAGIEREEGSWLRLFRNARAAIN